LDGGDAGFFHGNEREICGGGRGKFLGSADAQIVSHAFKTLEEVQPKQSQAANERKDCDGQNERSALEGFEFHLIELNKKPEQLKAALVFEKVLIFNQQVFAH
jgi:hypothetical protein